MDTSIDELRLERLSLRYPRDRARLADFLARHHLKLEEDVQSAFVLLDGFESLAACGCAAGSVLKCFAVEPSLRGQNALGRLVSALVQDRFARGIYDLFIITRAENEALFQNCGFYPVVRTQALAMLENRPNGPRLFAQGLKRPEDAGKQAAAIVMNCNPFTLGHQALVEFAARRCELLHIFLVEEDRSLFPTPVRYQLAAEGTAHLPNVRLHLSGPYVISAATFPTYFVKAQENAALLQAQLDVTLFAEKLAPELHIVQRFAGQEPLDPTTAGYNHTMRTLLPRYGIHFCEFPRVMQDGQPISASRVRNLLESRGVCDEVLALVPESTGRYLKDNWPLKPQRSGAQHPFL